MGSAGCSEPTGPIGDLVYVEIMARLSYAEARYLVPERADSARSAVLEESGLTAQDLFDYVERHGADVDKMFAIQERIRARVDSLEVIEAGELPVVGEDPDEGGESR